MQRRWTTLLAISVSIVILSNSSTTSADESRPNVLFIAVDDLRPELGCYSDTHIHSPNIDKLAAGGRRFERAYCQQAVCNPSRTSLMTGMRPDSIGVTGNHSHFRSKHPDVVTLPQHFRQHGYHAVAIGKIYHGVFPDGASNTKWDTMGDPESWSVPAVRFGPRYYYTEDGMTAAKEVFQRIYKPKKPGPDDWTKKLVFGPATESPDVPDNTLYDGKVADAAVKKLRELRGKGSPFFLAVGFIKPHSPYIAPKKYFDLYEDVAMPTHTEFPIDSPSFAGHGSGELRRYTDQPKRGVISDDKQRRVRQAYYACISYIDAQIGRVLDELERSGLSENTIVVLYGDHGYHLGEQGLWGKTTNFELDTRVPLIVRAPGMKAAGESSTSLVELVDLYPTLADLAGLPITEQLEGRSFISILNDPAQATKTAAFSQYPRGGGLMGYSMRTPTHRLTQWVHRQSGEIHATELYDYSDGLVETQNITAESPEVAASLTAQLSAAMASQLPSRPVPHKPAPKIRVACVGDSITYGAGISDRENNSYPALLQKMLGDDYVVGNFGYSGATLLKKGHKPYWEKPPYPASLKFKPNVVVINLGANDAVDLNWKHSGEFPADYAALIETYQSLPSRPKVTICEILPIFPNHGRYKECLANRTQMTPMIQAVAKSEGTGIIDLHKPFVNRNQLFPDGIHPNEDGALLMAQQVFTALTGKQPPAVNVSRPRPFDPASGTSFEKAAAGPFEKLETEVGVWTVTAGKSQINAKMASTGRHSLQIMGGKKSTVELTLADGMRGRAVLAFRAERWTSRGPFSFRIEQQSGGKWSNFYDGDKTIVVGRPFKSDVMIPLADKDITALRFSVTSPADTGAMIDDLQLLMTAKGSSTPSAARRGGKPGQTGFESVDAGPFEQLTTEIGTWEPATGKAVVASTHAKTGKQCLHLPGPKSVVELQVADGIGTDGQLTFWAERWTTRTPFSFRIEKHSGAGWKEVFNGDKEVRVGREFLSHIKVPLGDDSIRKLRFTVTSPSNTGILIDDIRLAPALPQEIVDVEVVPLTLPALVGTDASLLVKLKIETTGILNPISLTEMQATLEGTTNRSDLTSLHVYRGSSSGAFSGTSVASLDIKESSIDSLVLECAGDACQLAEGSNYIWIAGQLRPEANVDHRVGAACRQVTFSNGEKVKLKVAPSIQRMGVAVRNGGDDGVHTYRIPGLATTNKSTLIGVYDVRRRGGGDLPGDIDVGMSRSTDGGRTWEPMKVVMNMGDDPKWRYDGIGDPALLVDRNTGTIWVAATWSHGNRSWRGSGPGLTPEETGQFMLVRSDDDGVTWSKPINITKQIKKPEWCFILQGPGKGITMRDGTIVFAAQYQDPPDTTDKRAHRLPHSTIIYSKDHGKTWHVGTGAFDDTTESQVVELEPGLLMLNCRYNRKAVRVVMTTRDMGKTWQKHTTSERALIEPGSCMASLIDVNQELGKNERGWLLFSNPDSTRGRHHITIKASPDRGLTWPKEHRLLLDEETGAGYSCMSMIDDKTVGILYEGSQAHMTFQRISLNDLVGKDAAPDQPVPKASEQSLKLPRVFGSHMVLQANAEIPVWGQAKVGSKVNVALGDDSLSTVANAEGEWTVRFPSRKSNATPTTLTIDSPGGRIQFTDVLVGEVWVCAGQSNMEWTLSQSADGGAELSNADHPQMRLLHLEGGARGSSGSYTPQHLARLTAETYCEGEWKPASADSGRNFSAVAWYFGRHLQQELKVPVGLICPAVGGTPAEAWIPHEALEADPDLTGLVAGDWLDNKRLGEFCRTRGQQNLLAAIQAGESLPGDELGPNHSFKPGFMWEAGIEPLIPYAIRGAIWYQGESNAETPDRVREHGKLFPLLINQWRKEWSQGEFPFLYVQLPALNRSEWPWFRDGQRRTLGQLKNVGMAITIDTGHASNVHPKLKRPVGERLAKRALGTTYKSKTHSTYSGPLFDVADRKGRSIVVSFKHVGSGLKSSDDKPVRYFEVCGKDGVFHAAEAKIVGKNAISVSSADVPEPHDVRYAWLPYPDPSVNLFNSVGLPASPFTSEDTEKVFARRTAASKRPNILFIVSEDNSEHLGCYGEQRVHTPHLDALASGGVRYTRAYVPYSVCSPSRAAFLTGLYTRQTGHIGLATHQFSMYRDFKTMPAHFQHAGYYTGFLGKTHINPERLVEDYIDHRAIRNSNFGKTISIESYAEEAGVVMRNAAESRKPFLLIINYADAHRRFVGKSKNGFPTRQVTDAIEPFPWIGSDTPHLREEIRDYFNCMNRLDEGVGMVLDKLEETGNRDNTLVIYISDHGADFPRAKGSIYEHGSRIPMIVNYPQNFPRGKVESGMVSTIDILPTMLRAARLPIPEELPGVALQDIDSGRSPPRKYIHTFTTGSSPNLLYLQFGVRDERYKLVYNPDRALNRLAESRYRNSQLPEDQYVKSFLHPPEYELFDLQEDPYEWENLADSAEHKPTRERLLKAMQGFQREIRDPFASRENMATFIAEQKEYLHKPYKRSGFRWPHLDMFKKAQEAGE